jgi:hypothetical protein
LDKKMADLSITPVATQIKPVPSMSLGDMINVARGAQQYQQAAQINPLELQQKQQAVRTGEIALGVEEQRDKERGNFQIFMSNPANYMTNNKFDEVKFNTAIPQIMPLTGLPAIKDLTGVAQAQSEALRAKHALTQDKRELVSRTLGLAGRSKIDDPAMVNEWLDMLVQQNPGDQDLKDLVEKGYKPVFGRMQPGPQVADSLVKAAQQMLTPSQLETTFAPQTQVLESGKTVTTQKMPGTAPSTATIGIAGGLQAPAQPSGVVGPVGAGTEIAPGMRVPYPVRRADQPYTPEPTEVVDQTAGQTYRTRLINAQGDLPTGRRNVEEVIKQANLLNENLYEFEKGGGLAGQVGRKIRMAINSADYDILAKDLARLALSNASAMGGAGNTVSGLDMQQVANGTIKMPPEKLVEIARRVQADQTNLDLQAKGAQQFAQRFGDNNMKAYQQAWNANADTKVFEAMNIVQFVKDPAKQKAELNRLFPDPSQYKDFLTKYQNIKKLSDTGSL